MTAVQHAEPARRRIVHRRHDDVVVLRPMDILDDELAGDVREQLLEAHAPVIIDLDHCVHVEASAIRNIATSWQLYRPDFSFACSNAVDRQMMHSLGTTGDVEVFDSVEDALAAYRVRSS